MISCHFVLSQLLDGLLSTYTGITIEKYHQQLNQRAISKLIDQSPLALLAIFVHCSISCMLDIFSRKYNFFFPFCDGTCVIYWDQVGLSRTKLLYQSFWLWICVLMQQSFLNYFHVTILFCVSKGLCVCVQTDTPNSLHCYTAVR